MGRGNDNRDRRRGRGEQTFDPWGGDYAPPQNSFERPRTPRPGFSAGPASGPEIEAKVKWFNAEKGFGFVELTDGSGEAFLHIRPVEAAGYSALEPGTTLVVRTGQGQKGPQVTEVVSVDASTAQPEAPRRGPRPPTGGGGSYGGPGGPPRDRGFAPRPQGPVASGPPDTEGTVKWYDPIKGFGFVSIQGQVKDLFVHRSALERAGITSLAEGQPVRVAVVEGRKGKEVGAIEVV